MEAHAEDLRAEVQDEALVRLVKDDWRRAPLDPRDRALCAYAEKLTRAPWSVRPDDLDTLRQAGFTDAQVSDAAQVIAYFNYINRIADGLGVDLEPEMPAPDRGAAAR